MYICTIKMKQLIIKSNEMKSLIINNGQGFIRNFSIVGINIPQFGDIKDAKRFNSDAEAKEAIGNFPNCIISKDIWNL